SCQAATRSASSVPGSVRSTPVPPSTKTGVWSATSKTPAAATTAGMPRDRARIAVWLWGPPAAQTRATTDSGSKVAVSAGARSSAMRTKGFSECGMPGADTPRSRATRRARTSRTSAALSAIYPPRASSCAAVSSATVHTAVSASVSVSRLIAVLMSVGSLSMRAVSVSTPWASPVTVSARSSSSACTAAEASRIRVASASGSCGGGCLTGAVTGGGMTLAGATTRPGTTPMPENSADIFTPSFVMVCSPYRCVGVRARRRALIGGRRRRCRGLRRSLPLPVDPGGPALADEDLEHQHEQGADDRADGDREQEEQEAVDGEEDEHAAVRGLAGHRQAHRHPAGHTGADDGGGDDAQRVRGGEGNRALGDERRAEQPGGLSVLLLRL